MANNQDVLKVLFNIQQGLPPLIKSKDNPYFKSKYVDYNTIKEAIDPLLQEAEAVITHSSVITLATGSWSHSTKLIHIPTGQSIETLIPFAIKDADNPQKVGSALTYYKRYGLISLLGLATEDDDGNYASNNTQAPSGVDF